MGDTQKKTYIMALDQGTTSSRCILFDKQGNICSMAQKEFTQIYPQPGWVEHNPMEIWSSQLGVAIESMAVLGITDDQIEAIGITNQRETTIIWDKNTGEPVYNAIVWQCRRTSDMIEELKKDGFDKIIREKTGLIPDAYFSASKIAWILNNVPGVRERAERGELLFGTVDTWLIWNLTKGAVHVTDYTNASRTMLFDIHNLCWDKEILKRFNIPESLLPEVHCSSEIYGKTDASVLGGEIPIAGAAGDQQAALFGQCCFEQGEVKNTYGTGCFLLMNTGHEAITSQSGLLTVKCELPAAEHDQKVVPSLVDRLQCAADNVQHDGGVDLVHGDRLAAGRIPQTAATDFRHQRLRPCGIPFLGVRGHEDEILSVVPSKLLHLPEHHGQVQHGDNAGGIAVRSRIEIPVDDPVAVIVGGDDHILVLPGGVFSRQETDDIPSHRAAAPFIIIFQC